MHFTDKDAICKLRAKNLTRMKHLSYHHIKRGGDQSHSPVCQLPLIIKKNMTSYHILFTWLIDLSLGLERKC